MVPMEEVLYTGQVTVNDFPQLVADCKFASSAFILCERLPESVIKISERQDLLRFMHFDPGTRFIDYTSGRIFDERAELRWEKQRNMMWVVYLGSKERVQTLLNYKLKKSDVLDQLRPDVEKKYCLFGERIAPEGLKMIGNTAKPGDCAEVRIPRLLRYPELQGEYRYVRLVVRQYFDEENTVTVYLFQDLRPWSL